MSSNGGALGQVGTHFGPMQDFRRIAIWKRAHALALNVRRISGALRTREYASTRAQMVRAAESVPCNIVEGCGARTRKEFARFLDISIKSTFELEYQLQLAKDNGALDVRVWRLHSQETVEIRRMICGFRRALLNADQADANRAARRRGPSATDETQETR